LHIDGKSNRRSFDTFTGKKMLHSVSVFSGKNRLSLAQYKVDEKSNEITAIQPLIETLDIAGQTVVLPNAWTKIKGFLSGFFQR
jgi:hypothetical protein